jgi:uncharacterized membrane protein
MTKHYKEAPWWWYIALLIISFFLGLVVVIKEKGILPVWAYIVALVLGIVVSPFVSIPIYLPTNELSDITTEHHSLFSLRQWYCN